MIKITGENVKQAIVQQLLKIAPDVTVYKEAKTKPTFPYFFVYQISFTDTEERKNSHILSYSLDIRYRTASDPSTDLKLEQILDSMALKLLSGFNIISFGDEFIKVTEKSTEKVDGVLHFFCTVNIMVKNVSDEEAIKFNKLEVVINGN